MEADKNYILSTFSVVFRSYQKFRLLGSFFTSIGEKDMFEEKDHIASKMVLAFIAVSIDRAAGHMNESIITNTHTMLMDMLSYLIFEP